MSKVIDIKNQRFGKLLVLEKLQSNKKGMYGLEMSMRLWKHCRKIRRFTKERKCEKLRLLF